MKELTQTIHFYVTPHIVYEALMDEKIHEGFTEATAKIDRKIGGNFNVWDNYASGKTLELIQDKKIVQSWRASDWPKKHFSTITIEFEKDGIGTKLTLTQTNIPEEQYEDIKQGWYDFYWNKMKKYFETAI
ncbi:MAG: SRPBCC family protein [Candidatus Roizmanbacteria bacterium]